MALELMPDGVTFKKLSAAQTQALKRYYKAKSDKGPLDGLGIPLAIGIPIILVGGFAAVSYVFKDELQAWMNEQKEDVVTWIKGIPVASGGVVADAILAVTSELGLSSDQPLNPEYIQLDPILNIDGTTTERPPTGPFSLCQRWGLDADDWLARVQRGGFATKTGAALAGAYIIKNMKKEGCSRPLAITQAQWDDV
jgi:hypothetical protein